mmetsp:Transcript_125142/g.359375  ORF Transcript_125142/g.359375 Transcript_125142/m.359375 type:complete len:100 (-) Transcript_125142:348-647(-)
MGRVMKVLALALAGFAAPAHGMDDNMTNASTTYSEMTTTEADNDATSSMPTMEAGNATTTQGATTTGGGGVVGMGARAAPMGLLAAIAPPFLGLAAMRG